MNTLIGTIRDGQIVLDAPAELPEGTRVEILPLTQDRPSLGMREEDWLTSPEGIAALLKRMDQVQPEGWLSPEDDAAWRAVLQKRRITRRLNSWKTSRNSGGYGNDANLARHWQCW